MNLTNRRAQKIMDPNNRQPRTLERVSVAEDLQQVAEADSRVWATLEKFISEMAALAVHTSANASPNPNEIRSTGEPPLPSFRPAWAAKRLARLDLLLHEEAEALAGFNNRPYDPDSRPGLCGDCGTRGAKADLFCRQCGSRLPHQQTEVEETFRLFTKRRSCRNPQCGAHRVKVRRFLPAQIVEAPAACGVCGEDMADE